MHITTNTESCVGAGQCALVAEKVFDQDEEGIVVLLDEDPSPEHEAVARRAAALCPARAISVDG